MPDSSTAPPSPEPTPIFGAVSAEIRDHLLARGTHRTYEAGETLFLQDAPCIGLFLVEHGLVKISKFSPEGREQVLRFVSPGQSFNEVGALDGGPNPATATAVEQSQILVIPRADVLHLIAETPGLAETMIQSLAGRLRHLVDLVEDLSFRHVSERVARILLQSIAPHSGVGAGASFNRRITQREIAEMAGTSREVVARALKTLETAGAISIERGEITLIAPDKLSTLA